MDIKNQQDIQTASILLETAKGELDRKINSEIPEQTRRLAFYQGLCVVILGLLYFLFTNDYFLEWKFWLRATSASLCLAALLMSIIYSSGATYPSGICKDYLKWLNTRYDDDIPVLSVQKDLLKQYQRSIDSLNAVLILRGKALRVINLLLVLTIVIGCIGI